MLFRRRVRDNLEINLVPMIDLLLVVIIFLMLSTTYNRFSHYHINLPTAVKQDRAVPMSEFEVAILKNGNYVVSSQHISSKYVGSLADSLLSMMNAKNVSPSSAVVVINADAQAPTQSVVGVMEAVEKIHVAHVGFTVRDPFERSKD
ncbi:ExbD/TolR family protein [Candidatus Ichthyocystis hellenicum]|uniref:ExbD/TolR family protein n=1 Tax=Candidatus Ichthyocystis hellenicum TaxID=1561003 RepID=UPI000A87202F|nr:biopolymer transporter ExbD [Candidatus Ichthyocystis hellenicum]